MSKRAIKYEHWKNRNGKFYFHILGANGEVIAPSEGYSRRIDMLSTVELINGGRWPVVDLDADLDAQASVRKKRKITK